MLLDKNYKPQRKYLTLRQEKYLLSIHGRGEISIAERGNAYLKIGWPTGFLAP